MRKIVLVLLMIVNIAYCELWMPSIFGDRMVLQSGQPVRVWGKAAAGDNVSVRFAGQEKTAKAGDEGKWNVVLDPMKADIQGSVMKVSSDLQASCLEFKDVLVGEVWVLAGQSNMGWPLDKCDGGKEAAADANYPWLRVFEQWPYQGASDKEAQDVKGGHWSICDPGKAAELSGVGFFFARELHGRLGEYIPVALINTAMGGTYAECWIDAHTLENTPSAQPFVLKAAREIKPGSFDAKGYWGEENFRRPSALYNGKVAPISPFAVKGVLWYQGEGNSQKWLADAYEQTLTALIKSWRDSWNRNDLPFIIVQLPRFDAGAGNDWPAVRAAQSKAADSIEGVELAVTIDCGYKDQIHPADKEPVGRRLALLAHNKIYGQAVACEGPVLKTFTIDKDSVTAEFNNGEGLFFKDGKVNGFEICGSDGMFVAANAEIIDDGRVRIFSGSVQQPTAVRYGWFNWGQVSLFNAHGLPAAPFTTK